MRSTPSAPSPDDLTARATIRNAALRLFADRGPDAVTVRRVGAQAGVSAALVMHHFGSKAGLRDAVDDYVASAFDAVLDALSEEGMGDALTGGDTGSLAEAFLAGFPAGSPLPDYLRRLLLTGDPIGDRIFARWLEQTERTLAALEAAGVARPSPDPAVRAAFVLVNDLAAILLARQLGRVCGIDLHSAEGMTRWAADVVDVYTHGAFRATKGEQA